MKEVELHRPALEDIDIEAVRKLAFAMVHDWDFHEVAIENPFKAEKLWHERGLELLDLVGHPADVRMWNL